MFGTYRIGFELEENNFNGEEPVSSEAWAEAQLDFAVEIPTVQIVTESYSAEAIELYELPSGMILQMLALPGPAQIKMLSKLFKMALVDPKLEEGLDGLSFNELTEVLYQWYSQSPVRVGKKALPVVTIEDILEGGSADLGDSEDEPF